MKNGVVMKIYRQKTIDKIDTKIKKLSLNTSLTTLKFLNIRLFLAIVIFVILLFVSDIGYILAPVVTVLFYLVIEYFLLDLPIKRRGKELENEAIFFFEILALTLESGRNLRHALELTVNNIDSQISREFGKALEEVRLGKSLNEALASLSERIPSESINNAILNMVQANIYGTSIYESLDNQIEFLREQQYLNIKSEISKLPTKVSIISAILLIPMVLLIILAPVLINYFLK